MKIIYRQDDSVDEMGVVICGKQYGSDIAEFIDCINCCGKHNETLAIKKRGGHKPFNRLYY